MLTPAACYHVISTEHAAFPKIKRENDSGFAKEIFDSVIISKL